MGDNISTDQLRLFIERIERLAEDKAGIAADMKDVFAEAKANGFDVKAMREVLKLRKLDRPAAQNSEAMRDLYKDTLGLA